METDPKTKKRIRNRDAQRTYRKVPTISIEYHQSDAGANPVFPGRRMKQRLQELQEQVDEIQRTTHNKQQQDTQRLEPEVPSTPGDDIPVRSLPIYGHSTDKESWKRTEYDGRRTRATAFLDPGIPDEISCGTTYESPSLLYSPSLHTPEELPLKLLSESTIPPSLQAMFPLETYSSGPSSQDHHAEIFRKASLASSASEVDLQRHYPHHQSTNFEMGMSLPLRMNHSSVFPCMRRFL